MQVGRALDVRRQRLLEITRRLESSDLRIRFARAHSRLNLLNERLQAQCRLQLSRHSRKLDSLTLHLEQISPLTVLSRGYAIVQDHSGKALRHASETEPGAPLSVRLHRGNLEVAVTKRDRD